MLELPSSTFDVALADPPWSYYGDPNKDAAAGKHYPLMSDDELLAFPFGQLLAPRGVLFLWTTGPRLDFALRLISAQDLHFRGVAFVWVKTRLDGVPLGARGPRRPSPILPRALLGS